MPDRMATRCQIECQKECQNRCQKVCQIECQKLYANICLRYIYILYIYYTVLCVYIYFQMMSETMSETCVSGSGSLEVKKKRQLSQPGAEAFQTSSRCTWLWYSDVYKSWSRKMWVWVNSLFAKVNILRMIRYDKITIWLFNIAMGNRL